MKNIIDGIKTIWRSDQRNGVVITLVGGVAMLLLALWGIPIAYGLNIWNAIGSGIFFGMSIMIVIYAYYWQSAKDEFAAWADGVVRQRMNDTVGRITISIVNGGIDVEDGANHERPSKPH